MSLYICLSICACVSLWYAKYIWHVYQMSQKVQNVKMVPVCVCVYLYMCVCGMPNVKLVFWHVCQMRQKVQNVNFF